MLKGNTETYVDELDVEDMQKKDFVVIETLKRDTKEDKKEDKKEK